MRVTRVSKALVLSAGQGKRLLPLTERLPKCLIDLSGRSLLGWQLWALEAAGVREAVVVTGFGCEAVEAEIAARPSSRLKVRTLFNPFFLVADNLATCWVARDELVGGALLLNGDTLFEPAIAERLIAAPTSPVTVTVDRKVEYDADDMKVSTVANRLTAIGKTLDVYDAESIGFLRFSPEGGQAFVEGLDRALRHPDGLNRWYLSVVNDLAGAGDDVSVCSIEGLDWGEMDFPVDVILNTERTRNWRDRTAAAA